VVPASVREAVRPGDVLTWGWWPEGAPPVTLEVTVVDEREVTEAIRPLTARLANQRAEVRSHLLAQRYFEKRLFTAAYHEARRLADADPSDVRAWTLMERALARAGAAESRRAASIRDRVRNAPAAEREAVFGSGADGR
jgi:hypothetical protein